MDKFEYKIRAEEIKELISYGEFARAAEIADTIDWRRVKSVMMLCTISDLYKINRRYEDAKNMLLLAYERRPGGRTICYSLCELCIKTEEFVQAVNYYKEFVQVAPKDTGRYILQYKLYEAQDVSLEERISVLEELKKRDYREKWAYELAYLYHRVGLATRCVEECDELILWFGEGKYVIKAMELKMLHQPLTAAQQEKYDHRFDSYSSPTQTSESEQSQDQYADGEQAYETQESEMAAGYEAGAVQGDTIIYENIGRAVQEQMPMQEDVQAPVQEQPEELDFHVKTIDMGKYNTLNLQAELAAGLREVLGDEQSKSAAITRSIVAPMLDTETLDYPELEDEDISENDVDNGVEIIESTEVFFGETGEMGVFRNEAQPEKLSEEELIPEEEQFVASEEVVQEEEPLEESEEAIQEAEIPIEESEEYFREGEELSEEGEEAIQEDEIPIEESEEYFREGEELFEEEEEAIQEDEIPLEESEEYFREGEELFEEEEEAIQEDEIPLEESEEYFREGEELSEEGEEAIQEDEISIEESEEYFREGEEPSEEGEEAIQEGEISIEEGEEYFREGEEPSEEGEEAIQEGEISIEESEEYFREGEELSEEEEEAIQEDEVSIEESEEYFREGEEPSEEKEEAIQEEELFVASEEAVRKEESLQEDEIPIEESEEFFWEGGEPSEETEIPIAEEVYIESQPEPEPIVQDTTAAIVMNQLRMERIDRAEDQVMIAQPPKELAGVLSQESDGQISLVMPEAETVEKQITGQMNIQDVLAEWERLKQESQERREEEVRQRVLQQTGSMFTEFEASVRDGLLEQLESGVVEDVPEEMEVVQEESAFPEEHFDFLKPSVEFDEKVEVEEITEFDAEGEAGETAEFHAEGEAGETAEFHAEGEIEEPTEFDEESEVGEPTEFHEEVGVGEPAEFHEEVEVGESTEFHAEGEIEEPTEFHEEVEVGEPAEFHEEVEVGEPTGFHEEGEVGELTEFHGEGEVEKTTEFEEVEVEETTEFFKKVEVAETEAKIDTSENYGEVEKLEEVQEEVQEKSEEELTENPAENPTENPEGTEQPTVEREMPTVRALTQEEKELFAPYIQSKSAKEQLVNVIDNISMAAYTGNIIITGDEGMDTITLAKNLIREVQLTDSNFSGKVAKISGVTMNKQNVAETINELKNGALIIQKASGMNRETALALHRELQRESLGIIVIMEDSKRAINKLLSTNNELDACFTARMNVEALSNDMLAAFGRQYAKEMEYMIDELGVLALHTRIEELQTIDHAVTVLDVKRIVDEAIDHSNKKTIGHFVDILLAKRYDEEDMIILTEKDFA